MTGHENRFVCHATSHCFCGKSIEYFILFPSSDGLASYKLLDIFKSSKCKRNMGNSKSTFHLVIKFFIVLYMFLVSLLQQTEFFICALV